MVMEVIPEILNRGGATVRITLTKTGNLELNDIKVSDKSIF